MNLSRPDIDGAAASWPPIPRLELKDVVALTLGGVGAVLSIINTVNAMQREKVRLRVRLMNVMPVPRGAPIGYSIEITNLSTFAVTVEEAGFVYGWRFSSAKRNVHAALLNFHLAQGSAQLPARMEPRSSISLYFDPSPLKVDDRIGRFYVRTACGVHRHGYTPAVASLRRQIGPAAK
ncbi:MAG TPA: hypothetical protein VGF77_13360 [Allosphingosinicella sp.]